MRIGIDIAQQRMPWKELVARVQWADGASFDGIWGFDHFQPMYGSGPGECFEGFTTLAALSGLTTDVRLGLLVAGVTYRPPQLVAIEAITIDHASNGRLELSLGAAWFQQEHDAVGWDFPSTRDRIEMLDEALVVIKGLLTTDGFSFEGRHYQVDDATLYPRPVQQPHPPIWIGAGGEQKMLPLAARHADVWHAFGSLADFERKSSLLSRFAEEAGRDPASILRAASLDLSGGFDRARRAAERFRDLGCGYLICGWPSEGRAVLDDFVDQVLPDLVQL